ncbi:L-histidine N(alpha)-methyltransferase [Chryseotalea sanaruensis]|uniref:L-histidine N(Alpha)-methyltransferase n=1 Tax=Chryseotalea sanaruensis TaxID=2482724 RepID=A0A401U5Y2_9BACT|nr:L-histidine N(alpha)-methyltransferase [Chryseotalea sanaruensis]GCC50289.1 L-histidine N(alpha)-methyltransferase [Chryseotalea sanaruensis]
MNLSTISAQVAQAVEEGLFKEQKTLPSWLFYDNQGDRIFQEIMGMPEYYLTGCEYEILQMNAAAILKRFQQQGAFQLIELGAGDGLKTEILLKHFTQQQADFTYHPIDISAAVLTQLQDRLSTSLPNLPFFPQQGDYDKALEKLNLSSNKRKVILFLGSNIGNFSATEAGAFLLRIKKSMHANDLLFVGIDLKKDPRMIQRAYDDSQGITKSFNINLLARLNRELGANFMLDQFSHYPTYNPETGEAKSYLVSLRQQDVYFEALQKTVRFKRWEHIHTEVSIKYDQQMIEQLAKVSGLTIEHQYYDCKHYFSDLVLMKH